MKVEPRGWYLAREVGLLAGVSGDTIGQWARRGYIRSSWSASIPRIYSFQDVAEAMAVHELLDRGVPHGEIKKAIPQLRVESGDWPLQAAPLATTKPSEKKRADLAVRDAAGAWQLGSRPGQGILSVIDLQEITSLLRRGGWVLRMVPDLKLIEVDPDRLSGRPTIKDRRVPADKVARLAVLQGGRQILRSDYDLRPQEIDEAVRWYRAALQLQEAA